MLCCSSESFQPMVILLIVLFFSSLFIYHCFSLDRRMEGMTNTTSAAIDTTHPNVTSSVVAAPIINTNSAPITLPLHSEGKTTVNKFNF